MFADPLCSCLCDERYPDGGLGLLPARIEIEDVRGHSHDIMVSHSLVPMTSSIAWFP